MAIANKITSVVKDLGVWIKQPPVLGQVIAQIPKFGISLVSTELGNKIINTLIGVAGNIINEKTKKSALFRSLFTNMMLTFADPTANQIREVSRNVKDLVSGLKMKNFSSSFGALIEDPQEVVGAIRSAIPNFKGFKGFKNFKVPSFKKFRNRAVSRDNAIQEITPDLVTKFSGSESSNVS
ncbi:hypothetical protein LCGC14_1063390, partial [marine sediment metagenome]